MATILDTITEDGLTLYPEQSSLERMRYFFGQLLTQRDLEAEQRYHLSVQRLMQREAFGTGTVAGLAVGAFDTLPAPPPLSVYVLPGLAMDPDGRELILEQAECIVVAEAPVAPGEGVIDGDTPGEVAEAVQEAWEQPFGVADLNALTQAWIECGLLGDGADWEATRGLLEQIPQVPPVLEPPELLRDWLFAQQVGVTYVGLRYREVGSDPAPAVLDASCCGDVTCFPTRTRQGLYIVTSQDPFPEVADPYTTLKARLDASFFEQMETPGAHMNTQRALCESLTAEGAWRGLPPGTDACGSQTLPILCLAKVCWRRYTSEYPNILHVDNCGCRKLAPGGPALRALVESLTGNAPPTELLPRVFVIEPTDGQVFTASQATSGFEVRAWMSAEMTGGVANEWEVLYYPPGGTVDIFNTADPVGPGGNTITAALTDHEFTLSFNGGSTFPPGTYVWRVPLTTPFEAASNSQPLDGEPNPPNAVPSGNGLGGGVFEARFVVVPDPA